MAKVADAILETTEETNEEESKDDTT